MSAGIPSSLQERLRKGKVIPFAGAGVSRAVLRKSGEPLFPTWKELLLAAADRLEHEGKENDARLVRALLDVDPPDCLDAARRARELLPGDIWIRLLKSRLDPLYAEVEESSLALARAVWDLGSRLIVTTNYDRVLSWACPDQRNLALWDIERKAEQAAWLQDRTTTRPTVWHLHGQIDNAGELILTPDGFHRLYAEQEQARYQAARIALQDLLRSHSLLFVGFGIDEPHFGVELRGVQDVFEGTTSTHYALVRAADAPRLKAQGLPIDLLEFEDFGEPLLERVRELGRIAGAPAPSPPPAPAAPVLSLPSPATYSPQNPPFFVPFRPKGDRVIGRDEALQAVREQLLTGQPTNIGQTASFQGLGGLGKTQLAVEYVWKYRDAYPNGVIWLTADQDLDAQLTRLAVEARWVAPETEHRVKLEVALHRLRSYSDCLIVFDNVESVEDIDPYLPEPGATPHLLATSRGEQLRFVAVPLLLLSPEQSLALLVQEAERSPVGRDEEEAACRIAAHLGGLPLALEIAGAYLHHRQLVSWSGYEQMLEKNLEAALRTDLLASFTKHEEDLFATLKVQEEILEEEPLLGEVLDVLTWSGPTSMGLSLLATIVGVEEPSLLGALSLGDKLHLLDREEANRYGIHRLVARVRREEVDLTSRSEWVERVCERLGDWFEERREEFLELPAFEAEIDHLRAWQSWAVRLRSSHNSRLLWLQAYPASHRGLYQESISRIEEAFSAFQQSHTADPRLEAFLWNDLGNARDNEGNFQSSLEAHQRALQIRHDFFGPVHTDTARSLRSLASVYVRNGQSEQAMVSISKAMKILEDLHQEDSGDMALSLSAEAMVLADLKRYQQARIRQERSLAILKHIRGERHPSVGLALAQLGNIYSLLQDNVQALYHQQAALEVVQSAFGDQHPATAVAMSDLGIAYSRLGDFSRAKEHAERALDILTRTLGSRHLFVTSSLSTLGRILFDSGNPAAALPLYLSAFEILDDILKPENRTAIQILTTLLVCLIRLGRREEAFELVEKQLKQIPPESRAASDLKAIKADLLSQPLRPGFRQPSSHSRQKGKKRKK